MSGRRALRQGLGVERGFDSGDLVEQAGIGASGHFCGRPGDMGPDIALHAGDGGCPGLGQGNRFLAAVCLGNRGFGEAHIDKANQASCDGWLADPQSADGLSDG